MKILVWDIETSPMVVTSWDLWEPKLDYHNIVEEWTIICAAWKWFGEKKVSAVAVDPARPRDDKRVVTEIHDVLSEADVIVHHYGDRFDLRKFNARAIFHKLAPIPPIPTIDTKKVAAGMFAFSSNRLDYLGKFLGVGQKLSTGGFGLWLKVLQKDPKALAKMVKYCKGDVELLEDIYRVLRPFIRNHPNENLHSLVKCCPTCGSKKFKKQGFKYNRTTTKQQYQCLACHAWFSGETVATVKLK